MLEQWGELNEGQLGFLSPITDIAIGFSQSPNGTPPKDRVLENLSAYFGKPALECLSKLDEYCSTSLQ